MTPGRATADVRRTWLSRRALLLHLTIIVVLPTFLGLFWWQVQRVRQGNTLSWAYVFEWPFFAGYAVYLWWKLVHDQPDPSEAATPVVAQPEPSVPATAEAATPGPAAALGPAAATEPGTASAAASEDDRELAEYNRYLAALNANGQRKHW